MFQFDIFDLPFPLFSMSIIIYSHSISCEQFVMGVRPPVYWLSNLIADSLVYWIPALIFFVLFAIAGYTTIVGVNFAAAFLLFAGAIFATLSFNYLLSFLFDKYNTIIAYAIGINVLVGLVVAVGTGALLFYIESGAILQSAFQPNGR
jgi:hypothetical protein